ncbi:hypothetical protein PR002_g11745 [Phytophthora rubi]|uniref:Uncharacterized protein n=1 Tax=Phytophthora rubi TaxID=129364 RepID=A0A6A3LVK6_9STRA|nr:hypothetical protein PR002_g11745 [Phytophthora rubi]
MASKLSERLKELAAFLAHQHAVDSVEETLGHLQTEIADAMARSRASAQQCTILLFQSAEPPSLLRFLDASADFADDSRKREISAARGNVLELLAAFFKAYGGHRALTKQHVVDTYKACQQTARADPFNRVKAHALEVVVNVLKYAENRVSSEDIEPRAYADKLFYDIKFSKATQTAKGQMLEVIGYLVEKFPQEMENAAAPLLSWSEDALEKQFSSNAPEMMMVNGLLFALARLLECDPERYKRDESLRKKIYSYLLTVFATTVSGNLSRYQVTNSSEMFLAKHAQMFQQDIGPSGYVWFTYMKFCCMNENKTVKEHAFSCSNAIFQTLDAYLVETKDDTRKKCLNKILKEVLPIVSDSAAGTSMMAFAVQCLGWLARSIYVYLGAKGYGKIEEKLKTFGETLLALDAKATAWRWPLVSQYVQCVGHFVQERGDVPLDAGYVKFVGDVLCHLMEAYPQCLWKSKVVVHKSVIAVFAALSKWTVIDSLIDRFVVHTLMLSISNVTDPDQAVIYHPDTGELVTNLLYDYEGFWLALLRRRTKTLADSPIKASTCSDDVDMKEPMNAGRTLQAILFDSTVKSVVGIVSQLNLSYQFDLQTTNNGKNANGYTPIVPRDHSIMLNLTEFVERVLGKAPRSLLHPWIPPLMRQVFVLASKLPLVSSFYRIATVLVMAIDELKYFDAPSYFDGYDADRLARFRGDLTRFLQRICSQARFYQDELLLTSAEFVLAAPIGLVALRTQVYIVREILELGRSYLPAATVAIGTLERWLQHCPDNLEEVISEVVPLLSTYLDQDGFSDKDVSWVKAIGKGRPTTDPSAESDLAQLQRRILLLLGKCGGKVSLLICEPPSVVNSSGSMGNISSPFFRLELQLSEVPLSLAMDPIISHLGDLAAHSSVRRVKASASEGYHALVCFLCGTKADNIFKLGSLDSRQENMKRKHTDKTADTNERRSCQQILSWAIARFLRQGNPWEDLMMPSHWIAAYASVLASLCSCIKFFMSCGSEVLRDVADVENQTFRSAVAEKLLQTLLHRADDWAADPSSFDEIEDFCSGVVERSQEWAHQMQETVDMLLSTLRPCLAEVNSNESFANHASTIQSLSFFGSKILSAHVISFPIADKHAETFALVAKITMQYGQCLPDNLALAIVALKAAAACGWRIIDIFVNPAYRQVYGPVHNDVIQFIPTLAVWNRCASDLVSLSLTTDCVVDVLADVLHQVTSFKVYVARSAEWDAFTKTLVANIKQFINNLEAVKADTQRTLSLLRVLRYFLELCQQCSENLVEAVRIGPIPDIRDAIICLLKQRGCSYLVKAEILQMLSLMGPTSVLIADELKAPILESLVAFVFDEFPIASTDVSRGSKDFDVFHLLFAELLGVVERSNSVAYLKIIYPSLKETDKHIFSAEIKRMLARFSVSLAGNLESGSSSSDRVQLQLGELLDVLLDPALEIAIRKTLLEEVFTPLIECQRGDTLQRFYLMESTTKKSTIIGVLAALISTSGEVTSGGSRIGVFVAFSLVEILYRLLDPEVVRTDINSAFLGHKNGKGREFTMLVCKCASKVVTKAYGDIDELTRLACCAAYSCLLTAVSRTQKQEKFFDQILFQPALWSNVLDQAHNYELPAETEKFATIPLSSLSAVSLQAHDPSVSGNSKAKRNGPAALQFFTASSLSMDADASVMTAPLDIDQVTADYQNVEIELDEFNRHPCMIPLVRVLMQMKSDFGTTWGEKAMPGWMKKLFDVIVDPSTALNVRLFLGKVVLNVPDVFGMYASSWLPAIMETLLDATSAQKVPEFNYLLRDCCNLLLDSWKNIAVSTPKPTADRFINELIRLCPDRNNLIRDNNLVLITELLAIWKDLVSIELSLLTRYIYSDDDDDRRIKSSKQFTALQIVSALLNVGLADALTSEGEEQTIEDGILLVMKSKTASLYTLAAEVGGLYLQTANHLQGEEFMRKLKDLIIGSFNDEDFGRFLALLRNASMHHPEIIDSVMLQRLSFVLSKSVPVDAWALLAAESLTNAAANENVVKDIYAHVQSVLGRFVAHRHAGVQQSTLRAVSCLLNHLAVPEIERLIAKTSEGGLEMLRYYETHEFSECRGLLFNVAMKLYEKDVSPQVKIRLKASLLRGLCDPDDVRRKEAFAYWNRSEFMMKSCSDRLLAVFGSLYSQEFDEKWVLYATNLLVGMSKESDAFERPLFPSALGVGEYTETNIDATWESTTQSMTPLFSVEAEKFSARLGATQQMSNTTYAGSSQVGGSIGSAMQSQLFTSNSQVSASLTPSYSQNLGDLEALQRPGRRRFPKRHTMTVSVKTQLNYDKKASKRHFQDQYALQKKQEEARITRERKERQARVSIKRKYRVGEFPDIQISQQDIVDPILALCEVHVETSTLVFGALFSSIVATPQFEQSGNTPELAERLERTLTLSQTSPVYVGCVTSAYFASIVRNPSLCESLVVPATTIGEAGLSSGKHHLSELALEEKLIYSIQHKGLNQGSHEWVASWDLLHKLLSSVHKRNFLIALSMACSTTDESKLALQAQLSGDLPLAIASYKKAILDGEAIQADATRCRWQRFNCLEVLNSWDTLANEITDLANKDSEFLWKQRAPYLEQGVGHYMRSYLGLAEAKRSDSPKVLQELHSFIESATHDSVKHGLVRSRFPVEVCMAYILAGDKNQARVGIEIFYSTFLKTWRQTSSMASTSRLELMQSLSSIVEIDEVLTDFEGDYQRSCKQEHADMMGFIKAWSRSPPSTGEDGMVLWSQHTMIQNVVSGLLLDYGQVQGTLSDEMRLAVLGIKTNVLLQYANAAISCNILALASKMLKSYRELCNVHQLPKLSVQMVEVFVSHVLKLVDRQEHQSGKDSLNPTSVKLITRYYETATKMFDNVEIMNMMETANTSDQVAMGYLEAKAFASAAAFYSINDVDESLKDEYFSRSLDMFKVSCERINADEGASTAFLRCRLTFIEFLNDLLFKQDMEKLSKLADRKDLVKLLAENVLRGMAAGDRECAHYFPQICDVIAPYPDIVAEFEKYVLAKAPLWTCLQWSAQLMALLNGPIGGTVVLILEKMAEKYPVALFYDFMVTCKSSLDTFKVNLHRLEVLLANPVMEKFVAALRLIHHPEIRLKEGLREIAKLLEDDRTADARHKVELLWKDCFSPDRPLLGAQIGRYNRDWSRKAKRDIEKIMGKDGSKMTAKTVNTAREWIMNHFSVTPGRYGITKDMKAHLGDFAEWLEEFDHSSCSLELPGQYTTYWGPPDPSAHVRILSFDSMLGVLASKQLPKRLTLHCSDEKDYTFLVKGGEDLRLDQRIEQLFGVMNQILNADPGCRDQRLSLTTYDVIPMTQEIGILEWVNGTSTLKGVIESQLQIDDRCTDLRSNKRQKLELFNTTAAKAYESFLLKQRGASFSGKVVAPRSKDVVEQFAKVQAMIPGDLLRRQLLGLGSNFEAFLLVRDHFLKSLAVFNACSYVLGIGDRHLDNFLFDLSNGRVIGIDFGVSFGAGASVLPVPELIPFRYTRQMDFVFQPYDGANLLAQEMQTVFEALRTKRQVVESVMNVFLHEPLLDWQQSTTTHQKALFEATEDDDRSTLQDSDVDMEDVEEPAPTRASRSSKKLSATPAGATAATAWLPDVKIAIARRKLEGVSPGLLLKEELSQNPHLKQHLSKFHALVDAASSSDNGTNEMTAMSSLAQAQELLALATAPDLLGRTFQGWMPWL